MPIYEFFCPDNNTVYQFYAKSIAQGELIPRCPDNPKFRMQKMVSGFAITKRGSSDDPPPDANPPAGAENDPKMEAAMAAMEGEFSQIDENDPKAMGSMMRRVAEMSGEKLDGEMEEVVRKLEEGADPESLEESLGGDGNAMDDPHGDPMGGMGGPGGGDPPDPKEPRHRFKKRYVAPVRDPQLYDYD